LSERTLVDDEGRVVCGRCEVASGFFVRARGLLGRSGLAAGEGMLITKSWSIHTAFMRFPIDAVFLDRDLRVRKVVATIRPFRVAAAPRSRHVLELAAGEAARVGIDVGLRLAWQDR
jgi:uncharacterized membrane protein (UPF0127 family)